MQQIECKTFDQFMACIYECIKLGLTFNACGDTLVIELLGGY